MNFALPFLLAFIFDFTFCGLYESLKQANENQSDIFLSSASPPSPVNGGRDKRLQTRVSCRRSIEVNRSEF